MYNCVVCNKQIKKKDSVMTIAIVCSDKCKQERKKTLPKKLSITSLQYWLNRGYTREAAIEKISAMQKQRSPRCTEYWLKRGCTLAEAKTHVSEHQASIAKINVEKYTSAERKQRSSFCYEYWENKGYSVEETRAILSANADNQSIDSFISRYGQHEGQKRHNELKAYRKQHYSLDGYIAKHGKERGTALWNKKFKNRHNSAAATKFFSVLTENIGPDYKIYTAGNSNGEYGINNNSVYYYYDYVVPDLKLCVEFNGDYWHCNPAKYSADYVIAQCNKTAADIWKYDAEKINCMKETRGFNVVVVWESDNHAEQIANILEIISESKASKN